MEFRKMGWIEVICGPMFAGKTEELIRRIRRLEIANKKVLVFKPLIDTRYSQSEIVSHNFSKSKAIPIAKASEIFDYLVDGVDCIVIDEAQFFDNEIVDIVDYLADQEIRIIIAGLDRDFRGKPFGPMPYLLAIAEEVTKLTAICMVSGDVATRTQRIINGKEAKESDPIIIIGANEKYEPRSRKYHKVLKG